MQNNKIESEQVNACLEKLKKVLTKKQLNIKVAIDEAQSNTIYVINKFKRNSIMSIISQMYINYQQNLNQLDSLNWHYLILKYVIIAINENYVENNLFQGNDMYAQKRVIEFLLELVLSIKDEKEETVQIYMIRAIQAIMTNRLYHIQGEPVTRVFSLLINIYSVTRVQAIANASKDACRNIVSVYFMRIEEYGTLSDQEYGTAMLKFGMTPYDKYKIKALTNAEDFMHKLMLSLVDETVIYSEKLNIYEKQQQQLSEQKEIDLSITQPQIRVVGENRNNNNQQQLQIINEKGIKNGKFGWCIVCRNAASSYCKDTKVPVCSKECKLTHLNNMLIYSQVYQQAEKSQEYIQDGYDLMDMLCQLSLREPSQQQLLPMVTKCKIISLELIYEALNQTDIVLQHKAQFIQILREQLLDSLLKNSLSAEKQLLILTLNIFVQLVWKFRANLKKEIEGIIENVYFKFLDSSNSSFDHKQFTLKVFNKILIKPIVVLEMFVNYDCSVGQNNLFRKILDSQCRIIQGRYNKPEFQASVSSAQETYLKNLCLDNFAQFLRTLKQHCEDLEKKEQSVITEQIEDYEDLQGDQQYQGKQRQMKLELNKAVQKFNFKVEHCIKHLISCQYMATRDPRSFAQFLWENRDVNKDKLGEFFGGSQEFNQQVFSLYVDMMNFQQQQIDEGLRNLLEYFTLPGESQEIDRIMQKFASKFVNDNPESFNSAQAAYTLSYLLMMLQTDLHNPQNVDKMTIAQFINLAKGINDGSDLGQDTLIGLYDRISKNPLAVHAKEQAKRALEMANQVDQRKRHALLAKEAEQSLKKWFKDHQNQDDYFYVTSLEHVKFLLEQTWSSIFASLSVILEHSDDQGQIQICFDAVATCVRLMGRFDLDDEKDTFLFFLQKHCPQIPTNYKQITGIQTLLNIAITSGHYLRKSWKVMLQHISKLETLHQVIRKIKVDQKEQYSVDEIQHIERLFQVVDYTQIDKIFNLSINLDSDSILEFINALCELSKEEIKSNRTFLLSKVVEVADFNMGRIKIIWSKMWDIMRGHFLEVGCNKNVDLAIYAIDQLKQLSCKFLQQPELANYHFQKEFLLPFEQIFMHSQATSQYRTQLREYILSCMSMITNVCFNSLKSGWKLIMSIVNQALQEEQQVLVRLCVMITDKIMDGPFDNISEIYMELIQALIKLTKNKDLSIVLKSISNIDVLINYIASDRKKCNEKFLDQIWIPVLSSLSILYSDERIEVQNASVNILFQLLANHGNQQNAEFWKMILRGVIRPLFDEIQFSKQANRKNKQQPQQMLNSTKMTFDKFTELVVQYISSMQPCINDLIEIYVQLILQTQDANSVICLESLKSIVEQTGEVFQTENWSNLIEQLQHLLIQCSPKELLEAYSLDDDFQKPFDELIKEDIKHKKFGFKVNGIECTNKQLIQNLCIEILSRQIILYKDQQNQQQQQQLLNLLIDEHKKCQKYNTQLYMRFFLQRQSETQLPNFLKIEFLTYKSILYLVDGQEKIEFIGSLVERCAKAQIEYATQFAMKDDINTQLLYQRQQESILVMKECQILLMEIFPWLQNNSNQKLTAKWMIRLLKTGIVNNSEFFQNVVDLLEFVIEHQ